MKNKNINSIIGSMNNILNINDTNNDAIIYIRSSTKGQNNDANNQHSYSSQEKLCNDYCNLHNFNIINTIKETHSATITSKLKINNIYENYTNIHLIVADPSRITRELSGGSMILQKCIEKNIVIHSVRDNIRSDSISGRKDFYELFYISFMESQTISKRIKSVNNLKKSLNSKFGVPPFGKESYKIVNNFNNNTQINITNLRNNIHEQKIIELIRKLHFGSDIASFYTIYRDLVNDQNRTIYELYGKWNNIEGEEWKNIKYKECTYSYIADFLNKNNILKRGKLWNVLKIGSILKKFKNYDYQINNHNIEYNFNYWNDN